MLSVWPAVIVSVVLPLSLKSFVTVPVSGAADTFSVTSWLLAPLRLAVTVLTPPFSDIEVGDSSRVTVGVPSSSVIVSVRAAGAVIPAGPAVTAALTCTVLFGASIVLSSAATVTAPVLSVWPAVIVSVVLPLSLKSFATVPVSGAADTFSVTSWLLAPLRLAVTVLTPPFSEMEVGDSSRVTVGIASLSVISNVVESTVSPVAFPLTVRVSRPSATLSSVGTRLNVAVPLLLSAGMVSGKFETVPKSAPAVAVPLPTDTVTDVSVVLAAPSSLPVTVTVVEPAPSETAVGFTESVTLLDAVSSSVIVIVAESTASPVALPMTNSVSSLSSTSSFVGTRLNVAVPRVSLAGMVSVKSETVAKSVPAMAVPLSTYTVTDVSESNAALLRTPVTVTGVEPASSETLSRLTDSVTIVETGGGDGPSRMVTLTVDGWPTTNPSGQLAVSKPISTPSPGSTTSSSEAWKPKPT